PVGCNASIGGDRSFLQLIVQGSQVPNLHGLVATSRNQESAVGGERYAGDETRVATEAAEQRSSVAVPDFHRAVRPRRGDPSAFGVEAERRGPDVAIVSPEGLLLASLRVPDLHCVLLTPRDKAPAVRAERQVQSHLGGARTEGAARLLLLA